MMENAALPYDLDDDLPTFIGLSGGTLRHQCKAWLPRGLFGPKPRGFINDYADRVWQATPRMARMQVGRRGFWPRWISRQAAPLELTIRLDRLDDVTGDMFQVTADVRAAGRFVRPPDLHRRAVQLVRVLRYSLMTQDLFERPGKFVFSDPS